MKDIIKYLDLYGMDLLLEKLKNQFYFVSFAENSIPTQGSLTLSTDKLVAFKPETKIEKVTYHRNKDITLKTNKGYYKFLN